MSNLSKLYFRDIDSEICYKLVGFIAEAIDEELEEVTLVEAVPDFDNKGYVWCTSDGTCVERSQCKKAYCTGYQSKSGRGVCENRGRLYRHGEEHTFKVNDYKHLIEKSELL